MPNEQHPYNDSQNWVEEILGRGKGDPDHWGLPCQHEDFRIIPMYGYEDKYLITANGQIFSKSRIERAFKNHTRMRKGRWLKQNGKYLMVELTNKDRKLVHRLVALTFIPQIPNKPFINHIDSNPKHNCVVNLEWCTQSENIQHSFDKGFGPHGENKPGAKLTWNKVGQIRRLRKEGITN